MNIGELLVTLGLDISGLSASLAKATADYGQVATAGDQAAQKINRAWSETSVAMRTTVAEAFAEAMRASFQSVVAESESSAQRVQQAWKAIIRPPKVDPIMGPGLSSQSSVDSARAVYSEIANAVEQSARRIQLAVSDIDVATGQKIVPPLSVVASARAVYSGIANAVEDAAYRIQRAQRLMLPIVDPITNATRPTSLLPLLSETTAADFNVSPSRLQTGAAPGTKATATEVAGQLLTVPLATSTLKAWENQVNSGTVATQRLTSATGQMNDRFDGARMGAFSMGMSIMFGLAPALGHGTAQTIGTIVMAQSLGGAWMGMIGIVTALAGVIGTYVTNLEKVTKAQAEANVAVRGAQFGVFAQQAQQAAVEIEQLKLLMERSGGFGFASILVGLQVVQKRFGEAIGGEQPEEKLRRAQEAAANVGRVPFAESIEKSAAATDRARAAASAFTQQLSLEREALDSASNDLERHIKDLESAKEHELTAAFAVRLNALRLARSRGTEGVETPVINELYRNRVRELEQTFDTERLRARHQFAQAETRIEIRNIEERRTAFELAEGAKIRAQQLSHAMQAHFGELSRTTAAKVAFGIVDDQRATLAVELTLLDERAEKIKGFYDEEIAIAEKAQNRNEELIRGLRQTQNQALDQVATKTTQTFLSFYQTQQKMLSDAYATLQQNLVPLKQTLDQATAAYEASLPGPLNRSSIFGMSLSGGTALPAGSSFTNVATSSGLQADLEQYGRIADAAAAARQAAAAYNAEINRYQESVTQIQNFGAVLRDVLTTNAREADRQLLILRETIEALGFSSSQTAQLLQALAGAKMAVTQTGTSHVQVFNEPTSPTYYPVNAPLPPLGEKDLVNP